jgi:glutathione S-transferase
MRCGLQLNFAERSAAKLFGRKSMIVHGATLSPYVRKVLILAAEKGIDVESRPVNPGTMTPEYRAISPLGKIPAFEDGDFSLCDSSAIVHYLEAKFPENPMIPSEPRARGKTIWYEEYGDTVITPAGGTVFFNRVVATLLGAPVDLAAADKAEAEAVPPLFNYLETVIPASGFLVEDRITLADIAVVSPLINLDYAGTKIDAAKYPKTFAYAQAIMARPSFAKIIAKERAFLNR